eukprot:scpid50111/ scgid34369/ 
MLRQVIRSDLIPKLLRGGAAQGVSSGLLLLFIALHSVTIGPRLVTHFTRLTLTCLATFTSGIVLAAYRLLKTDLPFSVSQFYQECKHVAELYSIPTYLVALFAVFFDGAPERLNNCVHIVGGTDWRYWVSFGLLLASRRPFRRDVEFDSAVWVILLLPAVLYWFIHFAVTSLCWDLIVADLLARCSIILSQSDYGHWRLKFILGFALISLLRLNTYHCDPRIARYQPSAVGNSHLQNSACLSSMDVARWSVLGECWSASHCYHGTYSHALKHGEGVLSGLSHVRGENLTMTGEWVNGFPHGPHQVPFFSDEMYWIHGHCVNGTCPKSYRWGGYHHRASVLMLKDWSVEDVTAWLDNIGVPDSYKVSFAEQRMSGKELITPQLLDEEFLWVLNVSAGDSVRIATHIYELQQTYKVHQQELLLLAESMPSPACSLTSPCYFFGNVYPKIRRLLLASLNLPSKSVLFDALWHSLEMLEQMSFSTGVPHTIVHGRKKDNKYFVLLNEWSHRFHTAWPTGLLTDRTVLKALGVDEAIFITFFHHLSGTMWSPANLRWYFILLMDLDDNFAVDFSEFCLFVRAYSHYYPLQQRTMHTAAMKDLLPAELHVGTGVMESLLFHSLRLAQEQAMLGNGECLSQCAAFVAKSYALPPAAIIQTFVAAEHLYYGFDANAR